MSHTYTDNFDFINTDYGDNKIILLPQNPHCLFAYWAISGEKKADFKKEFGSRLWDKSTLSLKITNTTKNYSFYIELDDKIKNWYIHVDHPDCIYIAEIGRKISKNFFVNLATSNVATTPGDNITATDKVSLVNIKDIERNTFLIKSGEIYDNRFLSDVGKDFIGISSMEVIGVSSGERFGISSFEMLGININMPEYLGISSESLIKKIF